MKFFTSELYSRFRSLDDDVADQAMVDFEKASAACREYEKTLDYPFPILKGQVVYWGDAEIVEMGGERLVSHLEKPKKDAEQVVVELTFHGADIQPITGCRQFWDQMEIDREGDVYILRLFLSCTQTNSYHGKTLVKGPHDEGHEIEIRFKDLTYKKYTV